MLLLNKIELLYIKMLNYEKHQYEFGSNILKSRLNNLKIILLLQQRCISKCTSKFRLQDYLIADRKKTDACLKLYFYKDNINL